MQGRDEHLALLRELVGATAVGTPSVVVVTGEAGIGKTRLLDEFTETLAHDTVLHVHVNCSPGAARGLPFAAVREIVVSLRRVLGPRLDRIAFVDSRALAARFTDTGGSENRAATDPGTWVGSQVQLFDEVVGMVRAVARARRLVVMIEDVQWLDETSRDLIDYLARSLRDEQLMLLLTARTEDADYETCRRFVADLTGLRHGTRIELARLTSAQVAALVAELQRVGARGAAGGSDAVIDVERVVALAEGIPLLVEEVLDAGDDDVGVLADALVGHRLARLSPAARTVVESAAVAVLGTSTGQLARAAPLPRDQFDAAFHEAVLGGVLVRRRERVEFRHALLREAALRRMLPNAEVAHHQGWSSVIGDTPPDLASMVAAGHHRRGAGDLGGALTASYHAALISRRLSAYAEEKQLLLTTAELWASVPDAEDRTGTQLWTVLSDAAWATHEAMTDLKDGQRLVDAAIEVLPAEASAQQRAMLTLLWHRLRVTESPEVRLTVAEVLDVVADVPVEPPSQAAVLACLEAVDALVQVGDVVRAQTFADRAVRVAEAMTGTSILARALAPRAMVRARLGQYSDALDDARRAVVLAMRSGDLFTKVDTLSSLEHVEWLAGEDPVAVSLQLVELLGGDRPGPLRGRWGLAQTNRAEGLIEVGSWDHAQQVLDLVAAEDMPEFVSTLADRLAEHLSVWRDGRTRQRGEDPAAPHPGSMDDSTSPDELLAASYTYADITSRCGNLVEARRHVRYVAGDDRIAGSHGFVLPFLLVVARIEADLAWRGDDEPELGDWVVARIRHLLELVPAHNARDAAYVAHIHAELARRNRADTPARWMSVIEMWRQCSRPFLLGSALVRAGEAFRASGQVPEAAAALREAVSISEQLGARPLVEEALTVARRAHLRLLSGVPPAVSELGLTRREIDVLSLVAEGSSNSAIARTLVISPKTVSVHVSNILAKLGVGSRGEAAALAHRAGIMHGGASGAD
jgi:DNA-binding CsgD family transcriptional regulator